MNDYQKQRFADSISQALFGTISDKTIAIFGYAFKKDTGDTRESPAITVIKCLLQENALVNVYDPKVDSKQIIDDLLAVCPEKKGLCVDHLIAFAMANIYSCRKRAHLLVCQRCSTFCSCNCCLHGVGRVYEA